MIITIVPIIVAFIGLFLWVLTTTNAKVAEAGRILFFVGMLITVWSVAGHTVSLK